MRRGTRLLARGTRTATQARGKTVSFTFQSPALSNYNRVSYVSSSTKKEGEQQVSLLEGGKIRVRQAVPEDHAPASTKRYTPLSPHVSIYRFPFPALTSIANRATGVALSAFTAALGTYSAYSYLLSDGRVIDTIIALRDVLPAPLLLVGKLAIVFPLVYHHLAGIRHAAWDLMATGLDLRSIYNSGTAMVIATAVLTVLFTFIM
eukprot:TRINITY_DN2463_c4_g1_i1.p1 TRINITY_DN2463_c4_g1~~TRINITY_DN2463_c4_g1_i1.p1  ORF type:complete len:205 (-),score=31.19 TRINITY_DN2463_c4_g1_i1:187-801(-)